jgi:hypothetical protein
MRCGVLSTALAALAALAACSAAGSSSANTAAVDRFLEAATSIGSTLTSSGGEDDDSDFLRPLRAQSERWSASEKVAVEREVKRFGFNTMSEWLDVGDACFCALAVDAKTLNFDSLEAEISKLEKEAASVEDPSIQQENKMRFSKYRQDVAFCKEAALKFSDAALAAKPRFETLFELSDKSSD